MQLFVLAIGSPVDGLKFIGPFYTPDAAVEYADEHAEDAFWVAHMENPEYEKELPPLTP